MCGAPCPKVNSGTIGACTKVHDTQLHHSMQDKNMDKYTFGCQLDKYRLQYLELCQISYIKRIWERESVSPSRRDIAGCRPRRQGESCVTRTHFRNDAATDLTQCDESGTERVNATRRPMFMWWARVRESQKACQPMVCCARGPPPYIVAAALVGALRSGSSAVALPSYF